MAGHTMVSWQGHDVMTRMNTNQRPGQCPMANERQGLCHERMGSVISPHITHHYIVSPQIGASRPWHRPATRSQGIFIGTKVLTEAPLEASPLPCSARPLAGHKNEDEVTEAITRSDGSDQLWATYGIQIVNCVRYSSGTRKYSILVWWCNYECWLLKSSAAQRSKAYSQFNVSNITKFNLSN